MNIQDRALITSSKLISALLIALFAAMFVVLYINSDFSKTFNFHFLFGTAWNPAKHQFQALGAIIGTLITSLIAIVIALPLCILVAALTTHCLPKKLAASISVLLQVLAGIPSIIFGMWGLFILTPIFAAYVEPFLIGTLGKLPIVGVLFDSTPMGIGILTAGVILAIMIIPLLANMMISLFQKVPSTLTESGYANGATRYEVIRKIQLPFIKHGVIGSVILGIGRALGETMAVTFVIGNSHKISSSLLMPGSTIASTIANEFQEATTALYSNSIMALTLILMFITFGSIVIARYFLKRAGT